MGAAARAAGVKIVTGDTKVVERGKADGVFISTAGIGVVPDGLKLSGDKARPGDKILVSGTIGDHGVAIMSSRENLQFETQILSDSAALTASSPTWSPLAANTCGCCATPRAAASRRR